MRSKHLGPLREVRPNIWLAVKHSGCRLRMVGSCGVPWSAPLSQLSRFPQGHLCPMVPWGLDFLGNPFSEFGTQRTGFWKLPRSGVSKSWFLFSSFFGPVVTRKLEFTSVGTARSWPWKLGPTLWRTGGYMTLDRKENCWDCNLSKAYLLLALV